MTTLATQIYANFDQLMIAELLDYNKLGSYKIGVSFSVLAMPLIGVFSFIYISEIKTYINGTDLNLIKTKFYNQLKINFIVSLLFFVFCFFFLQKIIPLIYGIKNTDASDVGIILSLGVIFNVMTMVISYSLLAINKDKIILFVTVFGAVVNIILNYIFISKYGVTGGAWTSVATQFVVLMIFCYIFFRKINFFKTISQLK